MIFKETALYALAMAILLFGMVAIVGNGCSLKNLIALTVWAVSYGGTLAGSAYHAGRRKG